MFYILIVINYTKVVIKQARELFNNTKVLTEGVSTWYSAKMNYILLFLLSEIFENGFGF